MVPLRDSVRPEETGPPEADVVEVALLLPAGHMAAVETAARRRGLTSGQMIRRLIREFLGSAADRTSTRAGKA